MDAHSRPVRSRIVGDVSSALPAPECAGVRRTPRPRRSGAGPSRASPAGQCAADGAVLLIGVWCAHSSGSAFATSFSHRSIAFRFAVVSLSRLR